MQGSLKEPAEIKVDLAGDQSAKIALRKSQPNGLWEEGQMA